MPEKRERPQMSEAARQMTGSDQKGDCPVGHSDHTVLRSWDSLETEGEAEDIRSWSDDGAPM